MSKLVKDLKQKIENLKGKHYAVANLKLVYSGTILEDHVKLDAYNLDKEKFLVLFVTPRKGESNEQQTENQPIKKSMSSSSKQSDEKAKIAATSRELKLASKLSKRDGEASLSTISENRSKATPNENSIEMLMTLGFDRQAVIKALEVSHNDVDTAAEFLLESEEKESDVSQPHSNADRIRNHDDLDQLIATLARRPEFEQLQIMVVNDPQIVVRVASLLCQNSTALSQAIAQFAMGLPIPCHANPRVDVPVSSPRSPSPDITQMEPGDAVAIQRLSLLGFPLATCYNAYISCDRDQELAANLLITSPFAEEDDEVVIDAAGLPPSTSADDEDTAGDAND